MFPGKRDVEFFRLVNPSQKKYEGSLSFSEAEYLWESNKVFGLRYRDAIGLVGVVVFGRAISFTFQRDNSSISYSVQLDTVDGEHMPVKVAIYNSGRGHSDYYGYAFFFADKNGGRWISSLKDEPEVELKSRPENKLLIRCSYHEVRDIARSVHRINAIDLFESLYVGALYPGLKILSEEVNFQKGLIKGSK